MRISYVYHSCYIIEGERALLLVDFYKDAVTRWRPRGFARTALAETKKDAYVLNTHAHPDHFNPEVLNWGKANPRIKYVFSSDIRRECAAKCSGAVFLEKPQEFEDSNVFIKAFGSTDQGVSFLIGLDGKNIFHAGDLNNWHWDEESTTEEAEAAQRAYLRELGDIAEFGKAIDLALLPIDPRQGKNYMRGALQFIETVPTLAVAPMHFWQKYEAANAFAETAQKRGVRFHPITAKGQTFEI